MRDSVGFGRCYTLLYTFELYYNNYKAKIYYCALIDLILYILADVLTGPVGDTDDDTSDVSIDTIPEVQTLKGIH